MTNTYKPRVVVLTGAGVSAESGLKTFRDNNGLWENHRVEDVATPEGFAANPALVYRFYNERRAQLQQPDVQPNPAHKALAELEQALGEQFLLVTQNVDDLHEQAGSSKQAVKSLEMAFRNMPHEALARRLRTLWGVNEGTAVGRLMRLIPDDGALASEGRCVVAAVALENGLVGEARRLIDEIDPAMWQAASIGASR